MLIKESELIKTTDILNQLNEAVYLTQEESQIHASEVPVIVKENGTNLVDYEYINTISEQNGIGLFEALSTINQSNGLNSLNISIDEGDAITIGEQFNPELMVVRPISEDSYEYQFCEAVLESFINEEIDLNTLDEALLLEGMRSKEIRNISYRIGKKIDKHLKKGKKFSEMSDEERDAYHRANNRRYDYKRELEAKNGVHPSMDLKYKYKDEDGDNRIGSYDEFRADNGPVKGKLIKSAPVKNGGLLKFSRTVKSGQSSADIPATTEDDNTSKPNSNGDVTSTPTNSSNNADIPDEKESNVPVTVSSPSTSSGNGGGLIARPSSSLFGNSSSGSDKGKYLKYGAAAVGGAALAGGAWYAYKKYKNQPKSVIGKRIAALRQIYAKFMKRAQSAKDNGIAAKLKKIAAHVLQVIDKLLGYLQNKAG